MNILGIYLEEIYGGYRVKEAITGEHWIEIHRMLFNWRIVRSYKNDGGFDRGFCYTGLEPATLAVAAIAAIEWDGDDNTEPVGYFKRVLLRRR